MDWVDVENDRCSHFGISPDLLSRYFHFDMFHLQGAITKRLMTCLWKYILGRSLDTKRIFETVIHTFWNSYNVDVWKLNINFNSFIGSKIKAFIGHIPKIVESIKTNSLQQTRGTTLLKGWTCGQRLCPSSKLQQ